MATKLLLPALSNLRDGAGGKTRRRNVIKNKNIKVRLSLCLCVLVASGCWERQEIPVVPPPVPVYTLSGTINDIDTGEPIPGVPIKVWNYSFAYPDYDTTVYDTTDEDGYYKFELVISPGDVWLYAYRSGYQVYVKRLVMEWRDRQFDFKIPKLLLAVSYDVAPPEGNVAGIAWKDRNTLAIIDTWADLPMSPDSLNIFTKIWESVSGTTFERISDDTNIQNNRIYKALAYDGQYYLAASAPIWVVIAEGDTVLLEGNFYYLNPTSQEIIEFLSLPIASSRIRDISEGMGFVFLAVESRLIRWEVTSGDTLALFNPAADFTGIAVVDSLVYVYDNDVESQYLIQMDSRFITEKTYIVMMEGASSSRLNIHGYLAKDEDGDLWTFGSHSFGQNSFYKIKLSQE